MKLFAIAVVSAVLLGTAGCAFKMGNAQLDVLEGLSHPSNTVSKTETVTPNVAK